MKLFTKRVKKLVVNNSAFICIIDHTPNHDFICFKIYPAKTKTSYVIVLFSWAVNWSTYLHKPSVCARLIEYAIQNGWEYTKEKNVMRIEQGDFLIAELALDVL